MKVLFIGGTGSISTSCSNLAIRQGIDLWLANRGNRLHRIEGDYHFIKTDVNDAGYMVNPAIRDGNWDCVVNWNVFTPQQAERDLEIFGGVTKHYIFVSTAGVYRPPMHGRRIKEDDPRGGLPWPYAQNRYLCEESLLQAHSETGFPVTIIRPAHTYCDFTIPSNIQGLGYGLIRLFEEEKRVLVHNDGRSKWTLTHSDDFAVALNGLIGNAEAIGEAFHITHDESTTWNEIFQTYAELLGVDVEYVFIPSKIIRQYDEELGLSLEGAKDLDYCFDISKIKKIVRGYTPSITFRQGLKRSIEWHENNPEKIFKYQGVYEKVRQLISHH